MATVKQKIEYLDTIKTKRDYFHLARRVRHIAFDAYAGRAYQFINLRQVISRKMNEERISRREMAKAIGIHQSSLTNYLNGRRPLPYKYVERILALLFADCSFVDRMTQSEAH